MCFLSVSLSALEVARSRSYVADGGLPHCISGCLPFDARPPPGEDFIRLHWFIPFISCLEMFYAILMSVFVESWKTTGRELFFNAYANIVGREEEDTFLLELARDQCLKLSDRHLCLQKFVCLIYTVQIFC